MFAHILSRNQSVFDDIYAVIQILFLTIVGVRRLPLVQQTVQALVCMIGRNSVHGSSINLLAPEFYS